MENRAWEERSRVYNDRIEGVLIKSFPKAVNNYLHRWMLDQIKKLIPDTEVKILDLGCGYGRLSEPILKEFPKTKIYGLDISSRYVQLYNRKLAPRGKAIRGDLRALPFKDNSFDLVIVAVSLMYLTKKSDQEKAIREILRVLKKKGKFILIERNSLAFSLISLGGVVTLLRGSREITSVSFSKQYLSNLVKENGGTVTNYRGLPIWSLTLPLSLLLGKLNGNFLDKIFPLVWKLDIFFGSFSPPSLYIAYIGFNE